MKKAIRNCIVLLLIFTISSCYSVHSISANDYQTIIMDDNICELETKEGIVIKNGENVIIRKFDSGIFITDSTGIKAYKYKDLKTISIKKINVFNTILLSISIVAGIWVTLMVYLFFNVKLS